MQAQFHSTLSGQQQSENSINANFHQQPPPTMHTLRLRDNSTVATTTRSARKRKAQDNAATDHSPLQNMSPYSFGPGPVDYTPGGMPPPMPPPLQNDQQPQSPTDQDEQEPQSKQNRPLTQSKRAEQNRKAQRAFRERRDAHVKQLESRSQLLDSALASADEANRRWEECRALVDQLRIENAALRTTLNQAQMMHGAGHVTSVPAAVHLPPHLSGRGDSANEKPKSEKPAADNRSS